MGLRAQGCRFLHRSAGFRVAMPGRRALAAPRSAKERNHAHASPDTVVLFSGTAVLCASQGARAEQPPPETAPSAAEAAPSASPADVPPPCVARPAPPPERRDAALPA